MARDVDHRIFSQPHDLAVKRGQQGLVPAVPVFVGGPIGSERGQIAARFIAGSAHDDAVSAEAVARVGKLPLPVFAAHIIRRDEWVDHHLFDGRPGSLKSQTGQEKSNHSNPMRPDNQI